MSIPKNREIRVQITGGIDDIKALAEEVKDYMKVEGLSGDKWTLTFQHSKPFGDHGPLNKINLGFTATN